MTVDDRGDRWCIGAWTSNTKLLQRLYKGCLSKMCRWLCKMLLLLQIVHFHGCTLHNILGECLLVNLILIGLVNIQIALEYHFGGGSRKTIFIGINLYRGRLILCRCHLTRNKTLPDQLIQTKLVSV